MTKKQSLDVPRAIAIRFGRKTLEMTFDEIGKELGISKQRAFQIYSRFEEILDKAQQKELAKIASKIDDLKDKIQTLEQKRNRVLLFKTAFENFLANRSKP